MKSPFFIPLNKLAESGPPHCYSNPHISHLTTIVGGGHLRGTRDASGERQAFFGANFERDGGEMIRQTWGKRKENVGDYMGRIWGLIIMDIYIYK